MKNNLIVLLGPTGIGKTDIATDIAVSLGCEIISADSRQIFREMKIGTAVPSEAYLKKVKHHFIGYCSVKDYYSASMFERDVLNLLKEYFTHNHTILMTGGSGMYIDAVCNGIDDIPDFDPDVREKYMSKYKDEGINGLRKLLKVLDPEYYEKVDLKNHKRILRALEICDTTGSKYSSFLNNRKKNRDFRIIKIGLQRERSELYARINYRVDEMINNGLEKEAKGLVKFRNLNALNCVGYKEFFEFFDGKTKRDTAIELIKRNSRRYAKRQITWWGRDNEIKWFHPEQKQDILHYIINETDQSV